MDVVGPRIRWGSLYARAEVRDVLDARSRTKGRLGHSLSQARVPSFSRCCGLVIKRILFQRTSVSGLNLFARTPRTATAAFMMIGFHDRWRDGISDEARFLGFCGSMRHLAHGQLLQDLWVLFESDLKVGGYFVEFGAYDGQTHSNTLLLEERFGWQGIVAEPNADVVERLRRLRRAVVDDRCVWDRSGDVVEFVLTKDAELSTVLEGASEDWLTAERRSTVTRTARVPTVSLDDLLEEHGAPQQIDFLSVDTEGTELRILEAFNFSAHRPTLVAVEHNGREDDERRLDALFTREGYERRFRDMSGWDAWYRLRG